MLRLAPPQVAALCEKASSEVDEGQGVQIANYLCPGNYAISGGIAVSRAAQACSHTRMSAQLIASCVSFWLLWQQQYQFTVSEVSNVVVVDFSLGNLQIHPVMLLLAGRAHCSRYGCVWQGCEAAEKIAKPEFKARMTVRLSVAGAFHTDFMQVRGTRSHLALLNAYVACASAHGVCAHGACTGA